MSEADAAYIGRSHPRTEDRRFVTGAARFVADLRLPGMVEAVMVRSVHAHARISSIDLSEARVAPGVIAAFNGADLVSEVEPFTRLAINTPSSLGDEVGLMVKGFRSPVLATDRVLRVGDPVAVVVAANRYLGEDAAELVAVEYEQLPVVSDPEAALADDAPLIHPELGDNVHARFRVGVGEVERALAEAPHRIAERFRIGRSVGAPIETRGTVARLDRRQGMLTVWATTQRSHWLRRYLAEMLRLPEAAIRVIAPDMGGSFGSGLYNEDILIAHLAKRLGRPVRWIEDRRENLMNARHARDQLHDVEVGFDDQGRVLAIRDRFLMDCGAHNPYAVTVSYNVAANLRGQYRIDHMDVEGICVLTNKLPNTPVRGAGRPEATFVMERVMDLVAGELGLDPAEVRMTNLIPAHLMPYDMGMRYRDGGRLVYDSGDFPSQLRSALDLAGYTAFRERQGQDRVGHKRLGIGISSHVEGSGIGPFEGGTVLVDESGHVTVASGSNSHGQSHETVLAQVCADALGVSPDQVTVRHGDTEAIQFGGGTNASRSAVTAGMAVHEAALSVRESILDAAGEMLEAEPTDLTITSGRVHPRGVPSIQLTLAQVAQAVSPGQGAESGGLIATSYYVPPTVTFASSTHIAVVEVDTDTAIVEVLRYVVVDDCGRPLNPMIVDGQLQGGVAHGIGNGLLEEAVYDAGGEFLNASFMDYLLPIATDVPFLEITHENHPSPLNPLGVKGVGEGGTTSAPAAVVNAVADALADLGVRITEMPLTPSRLAGIIGQAGALATS